VVIGSLKKTQKACPTENLLHAALCSVQDQKKTGMLTSTVPECRPHYFSSSSTFRWSETSVADPDLLIQIRILLFHFDTDPDPVSNLIQIRI
jgi:hypothetical protein